MRDFVLAICVYIYHCQPIIIAYHLMSSLSPTFSLPDTSQVAPLIQPNRYLTSLAVTLYFQRTKHVQYKKL